MNSKTDELIDEENHFLAPNYHPLPIVIARGEGAWVTDVNGDRYLDALAGYSALNFGHRNPELVEAAKKQLDRLTMTSRAFHNDQLGPFAESLCELTQMERILPMNTGAEAVETALKAARKWGYNHKGIPSNSAEIIVMEGNFHGRTTTIISFSDDETARAGYGPYTPGFVSATYGDLDDIAQKITANTAAVLVEPIQGEGGVVIPPADFLPGLRQLCNDQDVLMIADEIQSGLGRTGTTFACQLSGIQPDLYILGKALGGGIMPLSAVAGSAEVLDQLSAGTHGSTFGGNPLACAVGREVVGMLKTGKYQALARTRGERLAKGLLELQETSNGAIKAVRCIGLWAGIDVNPELVSGRGLCEALLDEKVLVKDTHGSTIRLSPPLMVSEDDIDYMIEALRKSLLRLS